MVLQRSLALVLKLDMVSILRTCLIIINAVFQFSRLLVMLATPSLCGRLLVKKIELQVTHPTLEHLVVLELQVDLLWVEGMAL